MQPQPANEQSLKTHKITPTSLPSTSTFTKSPIRVEMASCLTGAWKSLLQLQSLSVQSLGIESVIL